MSELSTLMQGFFAEKLIREHNASTHTVASYRDTFVLLLRFASDQAGREPHLLTMADLDTETIAAFLTHLESVRGNSVTTRNARLAGIRSFFRYASYRCPDLNPVVRGWCNYFRHGVSEATFGYLDAFIWHRVTQWIRKRHPRITWRELYRRFLTGKPGNQPQAEGITMFDTATIPVTRYRWRAHNIPTPWAANTV